MVTARVEHFGSQLEDGLSEIFDNVWDEFDSNIPELFNMRTTDRPFEKDMSIGAFKEFPEFNGTIEYDRNYEQYETTYEFPEYAAGFQIERKLYDDQMYGIIEQQPRGLAESARRRREEHAAALFNNAFDSGFPGGDGVALCSETHPTESPDGPTARVNAGTRELNHDNLWQTVLDMRQSLNDRGDKIPITPTLLLLPDKLFETGWKLVQSDQVINQADHNPNVHQGQFKIVTWYALDNDDAWFLIDEKYMKMYLKWYDRIPIEFKFEEDFDTLVAKFRAYMRYECGFSHWQWIYGNDAS